MAAGAGYIEFATGDILTAAAANQYLASQVVMVFADAAARTSAIASPQEGMISYLKDTNATEYYSGSAWAAVGGGSSGGMTLLSTTTLSGSSVVLSSINQGYTNLFLEVYGVTFGTADSQFRLGINGNMTAFARATRSFVNGTAQTIEYSNGLVAVNNQLRTSADNTYNLNIADYTNTSNYKQIVSTYYYTATGGSLQNQFDIGYYTTNKSAITSLTIDTNNGYTFSTGTAKLWGIK